MKAINFSLVALSIFFGSFENQVFAKSSTPSHDRAVSIQTPSPVEQSELRSVQRILSFIDRQCQGQDAACFLRKLGTDVRYRALSKA